MIIDIPRFSHDQYPDLRHVLKGRDRPAVLEGYLEHWQASGRWTPSFFAQQHGECVVQVERSRMSPVPTDPAEYLGQRHYAKEKLGTTILGMLELGSAYGGYITYASIFSELPELKAEIAPLHEDSGFPRWMPRWLRKKLVLRPGFWLGPKGMSSPMHFDRHENLNVQLHGSKRWVLFSPDQSANVYYGQGRDIPVIYSPVDMSAPDHERFPLLAGAERYDFVLQAGQVLYLPPGWWHYVESQSDAINVNYWWWSPRAVRTVCRVEWASLWRTLRDRLARRADPDGGRNKPTSMPL
ncbi:cupin-like domain-containing protein [Janthinobacterium agaricidamnosum]|uniref:Transcription factor jumonji n=1 Tax=Janthinobacterium agaricidamnosum NBRC 102515 = DSM 9628 TaxID=1349767 RepID=W0UZP1_9BURK|nr:cupin-like domain-containing protein [Janthinobacterium agaricidamnosum]CDG82039.1 transcription factor jumonji [Janthinobacterium agaricidamnosum NBRC 102515 = DSM 9628]